MAAEFAVARPPKRALVFMIALCLLLAALVTWLAVFVAPGGLPVALLVCLPAAAAVALLPLAYRRRRIRLEDGVLQVQSAIYTLRAPVGSLDLAAARVANLREDRSLQPTFKSNGYSLPGFHAGHFRARGGRKLWALVTADRALAIPEHGGRTLLLTPERPEALLAALREAADSAAAKPVR